MAMQTYRLNVQSCAADGGVHIKVINTKYFMTCGNLADQGLRHFSLINVKTPSINKQFLCIFFFFFMKTDPII